MNEVTLPPSPNWYLSTVIACSKDGSAAWGSKNAIVIAKEKPDCNGLQYSIIKDAHIERVTCLVFSPEYGQLNKNLLLSAGDGNTVKIWNLDSLSVVMSYSYQDKKQNVVGVDWSRKNPNIAYCINTEGLLMTWSLVFNTNHLFSLGKLTATCLSACPHDPNLVAVGSKSGLVYIVNVSGSGSILHKLRGHDVEICSLSWCPVKHNVVTNTIENTDLLLASGAKDKKVFIWRAGRDGRVQHEITLPSTPLDSQQYRNKLNSISSNWTAVCWVEPRYLFTNSTWGELISWNIPTTRESSKRARQIVHTCHARGLFSIAASPYDCSNNTDNWRTIYSSVIWTSAQDRRVVCYDFQDKNGKVKYNIPTQGGYVYCIAACPMDTSRIAFGVGDMMLRIWNLSEPHTSTFDITMLWQKIKGSIRAIAWHPEKENLIAFGTAEGRIGVYDISGNKLPTLYKHYHTKTIYSLKWGPLPFTIDHFGLYSCGEGDLVYYDEAKPNQNPTVLIEKKCTELSWKPDFSYLAVGLKNGAIEFYNCNLQKIAHSINTTGTAVHCLAWHPESAAADLEFSLLRNYLAVVYDGSTTITVLDTSDLLSETVGEEIAESVSELKRTTPLKNISKVIGTLSGHSNKVVCLAWSPHFSGYLVSSSYDSTAQVWNVETQELLATFVDHCGLIYCCMWSPLDPDLVMTGSADFTLRVWRISSQKVVKCEKITSTKKSKKKSKSKVNGVGDDKTENAVIENKSTENKSNSIANVANTSEADTVTDMPMFAKNETTKKKIEKNIYFPMYGKTLNNKSAILKSINKLIDNDNEGDSSYQDNKEDTSALSFFHTDDDFSKIIADEMSTLDMHKNYSAMVELSMWHNNFKDYLESAIKAKRLTPMLVSLAPTLSMKTWRETCEAYANQLILESNPTKAVLYLLCIHKTYEAIDVFQNAKMFREAYVLARLKLEPDDPVITKILQNWAKHAVITGHLEGAAHCYVKLGVLSEAASLLARRQDVACLETAAKLALLNGDNEFSKSVAEKAVMEALKVSDCNVARNIISKFSSIKYQEVQVKAFEELKTVMEKKVEMDAFYSWLKNESEYGILQTLKDSYEGYKIYYHNLSFYNFNTIESYTELCVNVSYQIAMAVICDTKENELTHLIHALNAVSQFEIMHPKCIEKRGNILIKVLFTLDMKSPTDSESIYAPRSLLCKSLRAYLCVGLLNWLLKAADLSAEKEKYYLVVNLVEELLEDVIEKQTVKYWSTTNEITKLENQLSSNFGIAKTQKPEEISDTEEGILLLERLNQVKKDRKQFIDERVCMPSPILAYSKVNELIVKLSNTEEAVRLQSRLNEIWTKALS